MSSNSRTIGLVSWDCTHPIGGMGRHVLSLAEGLRSAGYDVRIFDRFSRSRFWSIGRNITWSILVGYFLRRWIRREGIDLLHVHTGPGGALLFGQLPVPTLVTANHTYAQQSRLPRQGWKNIFVPWERRTYSVASAIVCISLDTANVLRTAYGVHDARLSVIPCGIDLACVQSFDQSLREKKDVLFVGRPETRKGWDLLLRAWESIISQHPSAVLHVVGFCESHHHASIRFHGVLSDDALRTLLGSVRLTVCPSRMEGFGLIAIESIACGTPVVACDVDGLRRIVIHDVSGMLVPASSVSIAEAISTCLSDDQLCNRLRDGARSSRGNFDRASEIHAHTVLYDRVYSEAHA